MKEELVCLQEGSKKYTFCSRFQLRKRRGIGRGFMNLTAVYYIFIFCIRKAVSYVVYGRFWSPRPISSYICLRGRGAIQMKWCLLLVFLHKDILNLLVRLQTFRNETFCTKVFEVPQRCVNIFFCLILKRLDFTVFSVPVREKSMLYVSSSERKILTLCKCKKKAVKLTNVCIQTAQSWFNGMCVTRLTGWGSHLIFSMRWNVVQD